MLAADADVGLPPVTTITRHTGNTVLRRPQTGSNICRLLSTRSSAMNRSGVNILLSTVLLLAVGVGAHAQDALRTRAQALFAPIPHEAHS